jgi:tRNA-modifying protein YgfZ
MISIDSPALLEFRGPDAVRFLNGQLTQDVKLVAGGKISLPSCVTDAKGKLQFRVWITGAPDGALWVEGPAGSAEALEARLTRYLIADDVEVADLTGKYRLIHLIGSSAAPPAGVFSRESKRFGVDGSDWWSPAGSEFEIPEGSSRLCGEELEDFRIANGVPQLEAVFPPHGQAIHSRPRSFRQTRSHPCRFQRPQDKATGAITNNQRIVAALPTIQFALEKGAPSS